jgi:hypothetical protein
LTVYAGQRPNDAGSAVVAFTVNNPQQTFYSTPYPQFNVEAERLLRTLSENIVAFFSSTAFLAIAIIFLFLTVCTIIVITITTKKPNTNQRS